MTTRQRAQRGDDLKEFEGRVRKWRKEWQPAGDTVKTKNLKFFKWTLTGVWTSQHFCTISFASLRLTITNLF
jgi:hypothetical protein